MLQKCTFGYDKTEIHVSFTVLAFFCSFSFQVHNSIQELSDPLKDQNLTQCFMQLDATLKHRIQQEQEEHTKDSGTQKQ